MKTCVYPIKLPQDLLGEIRNAAARTGLSQADAMRQALKLGLPKLVEQLASHSIRPATAAELRECYSKPNLDFDALEHHCAGLTQTAEPFEE